MENNKYSNFSNLKYTKTKITYATASNNLSAVGPKQGS